MPLHVFVPVGSLTFLEDDATGDGYALVVIALDYGVVAIVGVYAGGALFGLLVPLVAMRRAGYTLGLRWSTHDAGGITSLDFELAELSDRFAAEGGAR